MGVVTKILSSNKLLGSSLVAPLDPSTTSVLPLQMSRAAMTIFLSWSQHHPPCNQQQWKMRPQGHPGSFASGELREGEGA